MDTISNVNDGKPILLFDGVCNLCSGFVQFVIPRDPQGKIRFSSLQSDAGQALLAQHDLPTKQFDSLVFVENGKVYLKSTGALRATRHLSGLWPLFYVFILVPRPIRNWIYDWVARNRYGWFGKKKECWLPTPELKERFL